MQTVEETVYPNRKTKEKNARSNYPRTPLKTSGELSKHTMIMF
jgi:hypothetical protein